jgi:hypothetical protein
MEESQEILEEPRMERWPQGTLLGRDAMEIQDDQGTPPSERTASAIHGAGCSSACEVGPAGEARRVDHEVAR